MRWDFLVDPTVSGQLCLTLLHSIWVVGLLALLARIADRLVGQKAVQRSYAIHVAALMIAVFALPVTYWLIAPSPDMAATAETPSTATAPAYVSEAAGLASPAAEVPFETTAEVLPPVTPPSFQVLVLEPPEAAAERDLWPIAATWLATAYALGVVCMLLRLIRGIWRAQRLGARAEILSNGPLVDLLRSLAEQWSMRVVPTLARAEQIITPKVVGLLRPTILLPTSAVTGLSTEELELILAHELAHVRRYDMWVNLVQRLAEALLFFNPALWYLSRRISLLREYCCDEAACAGAHSQVRYAQALLRSVELAGSSRDQAELASLAATARTPSQLRRRIARLFGEPLAESIRFSRGGLILVGVLAVLLTLSPIVRKSADAGRQEEVAVEEPAVYEPGTATISGKIVLEDGSPATQQGWLYSDATIVHNNFSSSTHGQFTDRFSIEVPAGKVSLTYLADGFAPAWHDPVRVHPDTVLNDITIVLKPGYSVPLNVVNEQGEPIPGATFCQFACINGHMGGPRNEKQVDSNGAYLLAHLGDVPYMFEVSSPGYEPLLTEPQRFKANQPVMLKMRRSQPTTGVVLNADGTPAPESQLHLYYDRVGGASSDGPVVATTDEQGRFSLDQLARDSWYGFVVETTDRARALLPSVVAGKRDLCVRVPTRRDLHVRILGDLERLEKHEGKPSVTVSQWLRFRAPGSEFGGTSMPTRNEVLVVSNHEGGMAVFEGLLPGNVEVSVGSETQSFPVTDAELTEVVFQLDDKPAAVEATAKPLADPESRRLLDEIVAGSDANAALIQRGRAEYSLTAKHFYPESGKTSQHVSVGFDGQKSRWDIGRRKWLLDGDWFALIQPGNRSVRINTEYSESLSSFPHPRAQGCCELLTIADLIRAIRKHPSTELTAQRDGELIEVVSNCEAKFHRSQWWVDPKRGYVVTRLKKWALKTPDVPYLEINSEFTQAKNGAYVAQTRHKTSRVVPDHREPKQTLASETHVVLKSIDLSIRPEAELFTLEGIGITDGARILVNGLEYEYPDLPEPGEKEVAVASPEAGKDEATSAPEITTYPVNKKVSDFPATDDFSTPEAAYATINRKCADGPLDWNTVTCRRTRDSFRPGVDVTTPRPSDEDAAIMRDAEILEVRIYDKTFAQVAARWQRKNRPIDLRSFELEEGRWLNAGNDVVETIDEAAGNFERLVKWREEHKNDPPRRASDIVLAKPKDVPLSKEKLDLMGRVEWVLMHNGRDVTARKTIEWGDVEKHADGNRSIRYKFQATIWDRDQMIMNTVFTFDPDGKVVGMKQVEGFPKKVELKKVDTTTKEGMIALVEDFFSKNFRDVTKREKVQWGEPTKTDDGNVSIRCTYLATIWGKDKKTLDQVFTFTPEGKFVSVTDAKQTADER